MINRVHAEVHFYLIVWWRGLVKATVAHPDCDRCPTATRTGRCGFIALSPKGIV